MDLEQRVERLEPGMTTWGVLTFALTLTLLVPTIALAQAVDEEAMEGVVRSLSFLGGQLFIISVVWRRRKKEIGGFLMYYYWGVYVWTPVLLLLSLANYQESLPAAWGGHWWLYGLYLITIWPAVALEVAELWVAHRLRKTRRWEYVLTLRKLLAVEAVVASLGLVIDVVNWPELVGADIFDLVVTLIVLVYFHRSRRVWCVFHEGVWPPPVEVAGSVGT